MSTIVLVRSLSIVFLVILLSGCAHDEHRSLNHNMNVITATGFDCNTIDSGLDDIKNDYDANKITSNKCHMDTHMLTRQIVASCGVSMTQERISYQCRSAMVHGIMEGFAISNSGSTILVDDMLGFCNANYNTGSIHRSECVHGIGNGFIVINDLDITQAITQCTLLKDQKLIDICISGVYGGLFRYDMVQDRDGSFCQGKPYESVCRNYIGFYFDPLKDTEQSWCILSPNKDSCGFGLGIMYSRSIDNDVDKIVSACQTRSCIQGAIWEAGRVEKSDIVSSLTKRLSSLQNL